MFQLTKCHLSRRDRRSARNRAASAGPRSDRLAFEPMEQRLLMSGDVGEKMAEINEQLAEQGLNIAVAQIEYFTVGKSRPADRLLQLPYQWVEGDPRRAAQGNDITYLVDHSDGDTASGLTGAQTEPAIDRAMETWNGLHAMRKVDIEKRPDAGGDPDILDSFFGYGGFGNPYLADIVHAGWLPKEYFDAVGGPGGGHGILAFSATFIFTDDEGNPTDINNDGYLDTALNEVYYNDNFGHPDGTRPGYPWDINLSPPAIDVETVALHEAGHSLGLGHFGPPPGSVMNPVYAGINHTPDATDAAAAEILWSSWGAGTDTPLPAKNPSGAGTSTVTSSDGAATRIKDGSTGQVIHSVVVQDELGNDELERPI